MSRFTFAALCACALETKLSAAALTRANILVIVNVLATENVGNWKLPTPSAYTPDEIEAVRRWVSDGGSLLLVADHMPFPGRRRSWRGRSASRSRTTSR